MVKLILIEIRYNKLIFSLLIPLTVLFTIYEAYESKGSSSFLYFIALILLSGIYSNRRREKRDRHLITLPLSAFDLGLVRIGVFWVGVVQILATYFVIHLGRGDLGTLEWKPPLALICLLTLIYSVLFIFTDLFPEQIMKVKGVFIVILLAITLAAVLGMVYVNLTGRGSEEARAAVEYLIAINPFAGVWGMFRLIVLTLAVSAASALTYRRRRSFV